MLGGGSSWDFFAISSDFPTGKYITQRPIGGITGCIYRLFTRNINHPLIVDIPVNK